MKAHFLAAQKIGLLEFRGPDREFHPTGQFEV